MLVGLYFKSSFFFLFTFLLAFLFWVKCTSRCFSKKKLYFPGFFHFFVVLPRVFQKKHTGKYNFRPSGSTTRPREVQLDHGKYNKSKVSVVLPGVFYFLTPREVQQHWNRCCTSRCFFFSTEGKAPKAHRKHEGTYDAPKWSPPEAPSQLTSACYQSRLARFCFCYLCCCCCCCWCSCCRRRRVLLLLLRSLWTVNWTEPPIRKSKHCLASALS